MDINDVRTCFEQLKKVERAYMESGGPPAMRMNILNNFFKNVQIDKNGEQLINMFKIIEEHFEDAQDDLPNFPQIPFAPQDGQDICSICLLKFKIGDMNVKLKCGHNFHPNCIAEWLKLKKSCPLCRCRTIQSDPNIPIRLILLYFIVFMFMRAAIDTGVVSSWADLYAILRDE